MTPLCAHAKHEAMAKKSQGLWPISIYYLFIIYLLKLYLPLEHKIAFVSKFQLNHNLK